MRCGMGRAAVVLLAAAATAQEGLVVTQLSTNPTEAGGLTVIRIHFSNDVQKPAGTLEVDVTCTDPKNEITIDCKEKPPLIFTPENYNVSQTCVLRGNDDYIDDGDQVIPCKVSTYASNKGDPQDGAEWSGTVTNIDNDDAELRMTPSTITTNEDGGPVEVELMLGARPKAAVTVSLTSTNVKEGTIVGASTFTFSVDAWNVSQTLTVQGEGDQQVDDDDQDYEITLTPLQSTDQEFNGIETDPIKCVNVDADTAGAEITPEKCELLTWEDTSKRPLAWKKYFDDNPELSPEEITVKLTSRPVADVTFDFVTSHPAENDFSVNQIVFKPEKWDETQTVTVRGLADNTPDGDQLVEISIEGAVSADPKYDGEFGVIKNLQNFDVDSKCIHVYPSCIETYEPTRNGETITPKESAEILIGLSHEATAEVTIPVASNNTAEAVLSTDAVVFQPGELFQVIHSSGVHDDFDDADKPYKVSVGPSTSSDADFNSKSTDPVPGMNIDDDSAGVKPISDMVITEDQAAAPSKTFEVVLTSEPYHPVTIALGAVLGNATAFDGVFDMDITRIVFQPLEWNVSRTVSVSAYDNDIDEGDRVYELTLVGTSDDAAYNSETLLGSTGPSITVKNDDKAELKTVYVEGFNEDGEMENITRGVMRGGFYMDEEGQAGTVKWVFVLGSEPLDDVEVLVVTRMGGIELDGQILVDQTSVGWSITERELELTPAALTFTPADWDTPQTVLLSPVDDDMADGLTGSYINFGSSSTDVKYNLTAEVVGNKGMQQFNVRDNDAAGMTFDGATTVGEGDAAGVLVTLVLDTQPMCNYSEMYHVDYAETFKVTLSVDDATAFTIVPTELTFFPDMTWRDPRTIKVLPVDDGLVDGAQTASITARVSDTCFQWYGEPDLKYEAVVGKFEIEVTDNDVAGVNLTTAPDPMRTSEDGMKTGEIVMVLGAQPSADVTIEIASSAVGEVAATPASVVFVPNMWSNPQTIQVTGVDDAAVDGDKVAELTFLVKSSDAAFEGFALAPVEVTNEDDDGAGWAVARTSTGDLPKLETTEHGGSAIIALKLNGAPTADVTITTVTSSDDTEGTVSSTLPVIFTKDNWEELQYVEVVGVDDDDKDGDVEYTVTIGSPVSEDTAFGALPPLVYSVVNIDNDAATLAVTPAQVTVVEGGDAATVVVQLRAQPVADVELSWAVDDETEGAVTPGSFVFTTADWETRFTITVTGLDDGQDDGDVMWHIVFNPVISADTKYGGLSVSKVAVTTVDGDTATPFPCDEFGGACADAECVACCAGTCGADCGASSCGAGGDPACCPEEILKKEPASFCGVGSAAPCIRLNLCDPEPACPPAMNDCHEEPSCERATGKCVSPPKVDGTECGEADNHTTAVQKTCEAGVCSRPVFCGGELCERSTDACFPDMRCEVGVCAFDRRLPPTGTALAAGSQCDDGEDSTYNDTCTADGCRGVPLCGALGRFCSAEGFCAVCCATEEECEDTAEVVEPCDAGFSSLPCVRKDRRCLPYGGMCADEECTSCCPIHCNGGLGCDAGTKAECDAGGSSDKDRCCAGLILEPGDGKKPSVCSPKSLAPCKRVTKCDDHGGLCEDEECEVCCAGTCGECGGSKCSNKPAGWERDPYARKCCPEAILRRVPAVTCGSGAGAPCVQPTKDLCEPLGGVCAGDACDVCCDPRCGTQCSADSCQGSPAGLDIDCCPGMGDKEKTLPECGPSGLVPCTRRGPCKAMGGICGDEACTVCCPDTCSVCGGDAGCKEGRECCTDNIITDNKDCAAVGVTPPCMRLNECSEHGGMCSDPECTVCCDTTCPSCGVSADVCDADADTQNRCCSKAITRRGKACAKADTDAPCVRVTKCAEFAGMCKDDACVVCCGLGCDTCGSAQPAGTCSGDAECCDTDIGEVSKPCSEDNHAPCTRVTQCIEYGGVCNDESCEVCCDKKCGCSDVTKPGCPSVTDIKKAENVCDAVGSAPCTRLSECSAFGGKCADDACEVCCDASCETCGGPQCHLEGSSKCCPETIRRVGVTCSAATSNAPCLRLSQCRAHDGMCNDAACGVCCDPRCKECGGSRCAEDPLGAANCCPSSIWTSNRVCGKVDRPCQRVGSDPCHELGGVCNDADCMFCCDPSCGDLCGSHQCGVSGANIPDKCCPRGPGGTQLPIAKLPSCGLKMGAQSPCLRKNKCAAVGGLCKNEECNVCCSEDCLTCGGSMCSSDPEGESKCCDTVIAAKTSVPACAPGGAVPCTRNSQCKAHGGICKDEACEVCCDAMCGECDTSECYLRPGGRDKCCAADIKVSMKKCGDNTKAPCILGAGEDEPAPADDDSSGWLLWFLLLLLGLIMCSCLAAVMLLQAKKRQKQQHAMDEMKFQKEFMVDGKDKEGVLETDAPAEEVATYHAVAVEEVKSAGDRTMTGVASDTALSMPEPAALHGTPSSNPESAGGDKKKKMKKPRRDVSGMGASGELSAEGVVEPPKRRRNSPSPETASGNPLHPTVSNLDEVQETNGIEES